ncbi:MAG: hypothetical protein R2754_03245 [Microthrixaceae bacterium]
MSTPEPPLTVRTVAGRREVAQVALALGCALALRLAYAHYIVGLPPTGDSYIAQLRGDVVGQDWVYGSPSRGIERFVATNQPPLFTLLLAFVRQFTSSRLVTADLLAGLSAATLGLVWWTARREFGRAAGFVALLLGGTYAHLIIQGGLIMSEVLAQFLAALLLLIGPVAIRRLDPLPVVATGAVCGLMALTRAELAVLSPIIALALLVAGVRRFGRAGVVRTLAAPATLAVTAALVYAPWINYTNQVLGRPVPSTGSGLYQLATSCETSLRGELVGYRDPACFTKAYGDLRNPEKQDLRLNRTVNDLLWDERAHEEAAAMIDDADVNMVYVRALRVARGLGIYRPFDTAQLEAGERMQAPNWLANVQVVQWFAVMALAAPGLIVARLRGMPLSPALGLGVAAVAAMALGFGLSRYRATFDPAAVLLASAGAVGLAEQFRSSRGRIGAEISSRYPHLTRRRRPPERAGPHREARSR